MSEATAFTIGSEVSCSDGVCGELQRVVVDPLTRSLEHLFVEPPHRTGAARLVPIGLVESSADDAIRLSCTKAEFDALEEAEETQFLAGAGGDYGYGPGQVVSLPYFGLGGMGMGGVGSLGMGGMGVGGLGMGMGGTDAGPHAMVTDHIPVGEVAVRRGDPVSAKDGEIGRVQGLVIDRSDHHVTHFLLDEGHLWGAKRVAIPIGSVESVGDADGVSVSLTKDEIRDLPAVDLDPAQ
jgi:sporulation protein YlmC with PRC-barrel domain